MDAWVGTIILFENDRNSGHTSSLLLNTVAWSLFHLKKLESLYSKTDPPWAIVDP